MSTDFTTTFTVEQTPEEVFAAVTNVRAWWSGNIEGPTAALGDEFTYRYGDVHRSTQRITDLVPNERIVWHIEEAYLDFTEDPDEWVGTDVTFEITPAEGGTELRFVHRGLVPQFECYDACSSAWAFYVNGSLKRLITTGAGEPNPLEGERG
ncbi:MAG TPA: SRPBCC domain-containing protein [Acidimicrobiales bacterium]|nr:SRPBCC domain-containing protein [Acidimicrobiales bacterium]